MHMCTYLQYMSSKGDTLVDVCGATRYANSTSSIFSSQSVWLSLTSLTNDLWSVWLNLSTRPFVCG